MATSSGGVPTGSLRRAVVLGRGAAKAGLARFRPGGDEAGSAQVVFETLGQLKGTALKVAQMLSLETGLLPDAWTEELQRAHYRAPPLSWPLVASVLETELGRRPRELFARFERQAFAAASLGQVHRAEDRQGRPLAVKVQYPGIDRAIDSDIRVMRRMFKLLPEGRFAASALDELRDRLREEVDYERELASTRWFKKSLRIEGVDVPAVVPSRSSRVVLTTQRLEGAHLNEWLQGDPPIEVRDLVAARLLALFTRALYELGRVHADANPGNFLFREDGRVGLIDFGCVKDVPAATAEAKREIMAGLVEGRDADVLEVYRRLGIFGGVARAEAADLRRRYLAPMEQWLVEPLRAERFDFGAAPGFCDRGPLAFRRMLADRTRVRMPRDLIFVERTNYGLYRVFQRLGARVDMRPLWRPDVRAPG